MASSILLIALCGSAMAATTWAGAYRNQRDMAIATNIGGMAIEDLVLLPKNHKRLSAAMSGTARYALVDGRLLDPGVAQPADAYFEATTLVDVGVPRPGLRTLTVRVRWPAPFSQSGSGTLGRIHELNFVTFRD